jgi:archaellum component FlaC
MDFGGLTLAQIVGGASECQLIKIEIKKYIQAQADAFSKQIADLQTEAIAQRRAAEERETELQTQNENLQKQLFQATLNLQDMTNNRDAAAKELSEAKQEVERLNNHIDDLRKEIAVGARAAINVIDTEEQERQKKELADKIRKERTIYNKEYVDPIKKSRLKAKLAISGEVIEFPWTEENKYFVIDETEVQPFRDEYGAVPAIEAETVAETDEAGVTPEQFQARSPEVPAVWVPSVEPAQQVVRRTVEERLEALEKAVFGQTQDVA